VGLSNGDGLNIITIIRVRALPSPILSPTPPFGHRPPRQELKQVESIFVCELVSHSALGST
jgi:hypothetical protein